jgi:hypothetical protein
MKVPDTRKPGIGAVFGPCHSMWPSLTWVTQPFAPFFLCRISKHDLKPNKILETVVGVHFWQRLVGQSGDIFIHSLKLAFQDSLEYFFYWSIGGMGISVQHIIFKLFPQFSVAKLVGFL